MQLEKETTQTIHDTFVAITSMYYGRSGTNDYTRRGIEVDTIVDRQGKVLSLKWDGSLTSIAPGIETGIDNDVRTVRIYRQACPVRVRFRHYSEYVSYDWHEHNSSWKQYYWIRYERSKNDKK